MSLMNVQLYYKVGNCMQVNLKTVFLNFLNENQKHCDASSSTEAAHNCLDYEVHITSELDEDSPNRSTLTPTTLECLCLCMYLRGPTKAWI